MSPQLENPVMLSAFQWLVGTGPIRGWILLLVIAVLAVFRASDLSAPWHMKQNC